MSRTNKNFDSRKREIVDIAEQLFIEKGYEQTKLSEILKVTKLSKGGFYHYFKSKDEIMITCVYRLSEELVQIANETLQEDTLDAIDKLIKYFNLRNEVFTHRREIIFGLRQIFQNERYKSQMMEVLIKQFSVPIWKLIEQGNQEEIFEVTYPKETSEMLVTIIITNGLPHLEDNESNMTYIKAMNHIIIKTLGIKQIKRLEGEMFI